MSVAQGRRLEELVEGVFRDHGYATRRNVVLEGRSGGCHEIDVLAEKSDGVTSFKVAVECKSGGERIEKDVVSKAHFVATDLGLTKVIVVALSGWRVGAERAAAELGVELWGPDDIAARLGAGAVARLREPTARITRGVPFKVDAAAAARRLAAEARGRGLLRRGREEIVWEGQAWVPAYLLQLGITRVAGAGRKEVPRITRSWHLYEALTGDLVKASELVPELAAVDVGGDDLPPMVKERTVRAAIDEAVERWAGVSTDAARQRWADRLEELGIAVPLDAVAVESSELIYLAFHLGFLRGSEGERIVALDGVSGQVSDDVSVALTANLTLAFTALTLRA